VHFDDLPPRFGAGLRYHLGHADADIALPAGDPTGAFRHAEPVRAALRNIGPKTLLPFANNLSGIFIVIGLVYRGSGLLSPTTAAATTNISSGSLVTIALWLQRVDL